MKMVNYIKKLFGPKYRDTKEISCGTLNTETGERTKGVIDKNGNLVYIPIDRIDVWFDKTFDSIITKNTQYHNTFTGRSTRNTKTEYSAYSERNQYTSIKRYFIEINGRREYFDTDAWEKCHKVIFKNV